MKKLQRFILTLLVILSLVSGLKGQTKTYIGIRGGAQVSSAFIAHTAFPINMNTDFIQTPHAGFVVKHFNFKTRNKVGINAGIQGSINYIQRGWKQNFQLLSGLDPYTAKLDYLEVPVEAILYGGKDKTKVFGTMGLYYERLIGNNLSDMPDPDLLDRDDFYTYEEDRDRKNGYGGRFSFGVFSDFPFGAIQLEIFTSISFSGVFEFGDRTTGIPDQSNLYSIGLSLAYFIPFGKMDF